MRAGLPDSVTVHSATNRDGRRIHVLHNWSWDSVQVLPPHPLTDLLSEESLVVDRLDLGPWDVRVLGEQA
jgi:beta-galactosidase